MKAAPTSFNLLRKPAELFLLLGLLFGIAGAVYIPYGAGFDEEQHQARIYELSSFAWLPNTTSDGGALVPPQILSLSYQRRYFLEPAYDLLQDKFFERNDQDNLIFLTSRSIYNPAIFLPQALIAHWLWQKYDYPFIPVVILCRLAGLVMYLAGIYLALRVIPVGKWVLATLALAPMALFQAATLNADGFTNAASFLFIAFGVEFLLNPNQPRRSWKIWGLAVSLLLLGVAKAGGMLLLPLLIFLPYRRFPSKAWKWIILAAVLISIGFNVGWEQIAIPSSHYGTEGQQSFGKQLGIIGADFFEFTRAFVLENTTYMETYYRHWVASYGHWVGIVPEAIYWLFPLLLLAALLSEPRREDFTRNQRLILAGVSLFSGLLTALFFFGLLYNPGQVGSFGRQGRYFIVTMPLLLIAFSGVVNLPARLNQFGRGLTVFLLVLVLGLYSFGLYATYYTYCDSTYYTLTSCVQPSYKHIDLDSAPTADVHSTTVITQTFSSVCGAVEGIRVRALDIPAGIDGTISISLLDLNGAPLASMEIPTASIRSREWIELRMTNAAKRVGGPYQIRITSPDIDPARPFPLLAATSNQYRDGSLLIGNVEQENDLIFKYICAPAWKRLGQ